MIFWVKMATYTVDQMYVLEFLLISFALTVAS